MVYNGLKEVQARFMMHYIWHYVVMTHPVVYLANKAMQYEPLDLDNAHWLAISIFGITCYFFITRYLAETPGRKIGFMYLWWLLFSILHFYSIPIYYLVIWYVSASNKYWQDGRQEKFADRPQTATWADAIKEQPPPPDERGRRRKR